MPFNFLLRYFTLFTAAKSGFFVTPDFGIRQAWLVTLQLLDFKTSLPVIYCNIPIVVVTYRFKINHRSLRNMLLKSVHIKLLFFSLAVLMCITSCEKEYSYEGGNVPVAPVVIVDTTRPVDTTVLDPGELPGCPFCIETNDIAEAAWSFKTGNSLLCGVVDTAIMLGLARNTFTFFGPATCGTDTGLIFTVSMGPGALTQDIENVVATNAVYYYYHTNAPYILVSHYDQPFRLTITKYEHATHMVTGTFSGAGYRQDGRAVNVTDGKFKFRII